MLMCRMILIKMKYWRLFKLKTVRAFSFHFGQERDFPTETVKFGPERMYIDCWVKKQTYDTFKEILGSGMQYHLQVSCCLIMLLSRDCLFPVW